PLIHPLFKGTLLSEGFQDILSKSSKVYLAILHLSSDFVQMYYILANTLSAVSKSSRYFFTVKQLLG
ncbi:MAG: hypothetical protein SFW36_04520, partial [Leptolyngbyaceae cyanobacterium bins.59]|nr:hypothetical protein [Leptolyngbyaceae cyanobacterium bins.59]